ncbi:restriction endonuclease subunit S [Pseudomonas granadensis]|uniref:Restriction endonuclease subunit S n=1 Tax=Pseudomonas granadensis TaxID=1421430 RepID=A0ABX7GEC6_9PSED|nr:restriction endonuclease subunit S [Pseudomonas granadensis]QRK83719.1 restriction endonuclease subunit S [Pseudomonas granadensis]
MSSFVTLTLGEVATFVRGITFKPEDVVALGTEGSVACMRTKNVQENLDLSDVFAVKKDLVRRADQFLQEGDILVSSANSWNLVGKCSWIPELQFSASFGGFVSVLRANPEKIFPRFLYWWFSSSRIQSLARSFGNKTTSISNLNFDRCLELGIELPSLEEQMRISSILDQAESLKIRRKDAVAELNVLIGELFVDLFGDARSIKERWEVKKLKDLVLEFRYGTSEKSGEHDTPVLRIPNVSKGEVDISDLKYVSLGVQEFERLLLKDGDLLFVRSNGNPDFVGRCAVFESLNVERGFVYASYLIRARLDRDIISPNYLCEFLLGSMGRKSLLSNSKTSAGQYNINIQGLGSIDVPVPPMQMQEAFYKKLSSVKGLRQMHLDSLAKLEHLFDTLQVRAFRGEL